MLSLCRHLPEDEKGRPGLRTFHYELGPVQSVSKIVLSNRSDFQFMAVIDCIDKVTTIAAGPKINTLTQPWADQLRELLCGSSCEGTVGYRGFLLQDSYFETQS
ncbi:hypothetical protein BaRGS_00013745 [Batillaria attramentaria]|uniref:Uncharacterized protein n=1 Tax=Batillaria attramentaria TaxID=370345 RepID=A0ABD0L778_9CAEN